MNRRLEVVVVGGGITGVSVMRSLAERGLSSVLVERASLAAGATGRNAGFLIEGVAANYRDAARTYGRERAREVWEFTRENRRLLIESLSGHAVGLRQRGSWSLAASGDEEAALRESAELQRADGIDCTWMAEPRVTGPGAYGGLLHPEDAELDSGAAVRALASELGAGSIREGVEVTALEPGESEVRVHTSSGEMSAAQVVLATNAYTPLMWPGTQIRAVRGQMLETEPAAGVVADRPVYSHWGFRYWRQRDDGAVLLGGWRDTGIDQEVGYVEEPTPAIQAHLDAQLDDLGVRARVSRRWAGTMGFTPDGLPLVGPSPGTPRVWLCGGYNGHGMAFATLCTRHLVAEMTGSGGIPRWLRADRPLLPEPATPAST